MDALENPEKHVRIVISAFFFFALRDNNLGWFLRWGYFYVFQLKCFKQEDVNIRTFLFVLT